MATKSKATRQKRNYGDTPIKEVKGKGGKTRYRADAYLGDLPDGKPNRKSRTFDTYAQASAWADEMKSKARAGALPNDNGRRVEAVLAQYLDACTDVKQSTLSGYQRVVEKYLGPHLGHVPLSRLHAEHIRHMMREVAEQSTEKEANRALRDLRRVLKFAQENDWIVKNWADKVKPIKVEERVMPFWEPAEVARFLQAAKGHRLYALFYLALSYGLRIGELMALRWEDVDWTRGMIRVRLAWDQRFGLTDPKRGSRRDIYVTPVTLDILRAHKATQDSATSSDNWQDNGLIFPTTVGTHSNHSNIRRAFNALIAAAEGIRRITIHDMRHTAASGMIRAGHTVPLVAAILGHSDPAFTYRRYIHLFEEQKRATVKDAHDLYGLDPHPQPVEPAPAQAASN